MGVITGSTSSCLSKHLEITPRARKLARQVAIESRNCDKTIFVKADQRLIIKAEYTSPSACHITTCDTSLCTAKVRTSHVALSF